MITISNGINTLRVTSGAFKEIFKAQGFFEMPENTTKMLSDASVTSGVKLPEVTDETTTEAISGQETGVLEPEAIPEREITPVSEGVDLSEIPLSQMTDKQLRAYADQLGVDLTGVTSRKAVRAKIRAAL